MLRKVLRIFICVALMVILCVGTAFAAETFSEAEIAKLRTDGAARVALHKTIEMMPAEEFKQYKPEIESAVYYKSKRLSPTAASEENIRITFKTLPGYEKYRDIQLPAGFDGYEMLMATSKNGEYERVGGFSYYPYAKDTNVPTCYYAADITKYEDEDYSKMYIKVRYFRRIDDQMVYTKWSDVYKASWPVDGVDGQSAEMVERYNYVGFSLEGGTYYRGVTVKLSAEDGAKIYYTTDGSKPTTKSKRYTKALNISKTTTLKAIAVKNGKKTKIYTQKYTMKVLAPPYKTIQLVAKNGKLKYKITLEPMDSKTTMYYTTDGSKPTKKSKKYTKTFYMDVDKTLRVRSYKTGLTSSTATIELPEPPGEWRPDGWKGETQTSGDVTITGSNGIAGQFTDVSTETRRFHTPGMDRDQVESAINGYVGYVYSRRFFDDGISMNYADAGKFAKIIETNGKVGVNVFGWRKNYGSDFATNGVLNMVMESFYFFTEDKDVAYALWSVVDYLNIYGSKYTTNEKIESFGFTITGETDTSMDLTMNGVKIHWEWGDDISGSNFYFE